MRLHFFKTYKTNILCSVKGRLGPSFLSYEVKKTFPENAQPPEVTEQAGLQSFIKVDPLQPWIVFLDVCLKFRLQA